jgi:hypothetical protein
MASGARRVPTLAVAASNPKTFKIIVEPPVCEALFDHDETLLNLVRSRGIKGNYQFAGQESVSVDELEKVHTETRARGYLIVVVSQWSNQIIRKNALQLPDIKSQSHPGGMVVEIISSFWLSRCRRMVLLPPTKTILSADFLREQWLPDPTWDEFNIRPPSSSEHLFVRDREYIFSNICHIVV